MKTTEVKELVRNWYGGVAAGSPGCCGPTTALQEASRGMGYSEAELASLPEGADLGLGCGNPQALAALRVPRPGGGTAIADVVSTAPLPAEPAAEASLRCACLAGAATTRQLEDWLRGAGFIDIRITIKPGSRELVESWAPGRGIEEFAASATIEGRKPALRQ